MALFPNWVTMHFGMGGGAIVRPAGVSHWVGVWLVQERISRVHFLGQGGSSVMVTSAKDLRASGHAIGISRASQSSCLSLSRQSGSEMEEN